MKNVLKKFATFAFSMTFAILAALTPVSMSFAAEPATESGENAAWVRAKLTWQYDAGVTGLDDSLLELASSGWSKSGDWYYYNVPVNPGDRVRLINGVRIPYEWDNDTVNKNFRLIVTVEAGEAAPGDIGWNENTEAVFSEDFTAWSQGYQTDEDIWVEEGGIRICIHEYQLDEYGNEVDYVNDKIVVPGQFVSKIVEIEVDADSKKGSNVKLVPEPPVKKVLMGKIDVNGKNVNWMSELTYTITVKNPAPDEREITIYDTVDEVLEITDPCGAEVSGNELKWIVTVEGHGEATVQFKARANKNFTAEDAAIIYNTADADIVGKRLTSNKVVVGMGNVSDLAMSLARSKAGLDNGLGSAGNKVGNGLDNMKDKLGNGLDNMKDALSRATGDYGIFGILALGILFVLGILLIVSKRRNKKEREETAHEKDQ